MKTFLLAVFSLFVSAELLSQNTLTFEQPAGTKTWTEGGVVWTFTNGGIDEIRTNLPKNGAGHGYTQSQNHSTLVADKSISVTGLWLKFDSYSSSSAIKAYDSNDNLLYNVPLNSSSYTSQYTFLTLNWTNIKKIKFEVTSNMLPPMNILFPVNIYFDDLAFSIFSDTTPPSMFCFNPSAVCNSYIVPDYKPSVMLYDNITPYNQIVFTQSVPIGTVITANTSLNLSATDLAGNISTCIIQIRINTPTTSTQNISAITSYKDPIGTFHYISKIFTFTVPNAKGCDSTVTVNLTITQQLNILNFDVAPNLTTWNEDGKSWSFVGGTNKTGNGNDAKNGIGFGKASSGSISKLIFPSVLNLQKIWIKFTGGFSLPTYATIYGYNSLGNVLYQQIINSNNSYQQLTLNWNEVSSIGFSVPYIQSVGPPPNFPMSIDLFFDDLEYSVSVPTITCPSNKTLCIDSGLPNYQNLVTINGGNVSNTLVQSPIAGTNFTTPTTVTFNLQNGSASIATCSFNVSPLAKTSSTNSISACNTYTSPLGVVHNTSQNIIEVIPNRAGCDSTITINLTINNNSTTNITVNAINQYTHSNGITYYFPTTITQVLQSSKGCDSTVITVINITSDYQTLDFNEISGINSWNEDGHLWSGWNITNGNAKSGIGQAQIYSNSFTLDPQIGPRLIAERPIDVQGFWMKTQDGINISEAKVFGFDENNILKNQLTIPSSFFTNTYKFLPLNWTQIKKIAVQYRTPPPVPTNPSFNTAFFIDELKYKMISDTVPPVITNCPISKSICINSSLPNYITLINVTDNFGIKSIIQNPIAGTVISIITDVVITATDNSQNESTCSFRVYPKQNSNSIITVTACGGYRSPAGKNLLTSGIYNDTIPNAAGCDSSITINLTIITPTPPTNVTISKNNICSNETILLSATCNIGTPKWYADPYSIFTDIGQGVLTIKPNYSRKYYVRCVTNNCRSNASETPQIEVDKVPPSSPTILANNTTVCVGQNITLTGLNCTNGNIKWFNGSIDSTITVVAQVSRIYKAICAGNNTCNSDSSEVAITVKSFNGQKPTLNLLSGNRTCRGGYAQIQVSGCTDNYAKFSNGSLVSLSPYYNIGSFKISKNTYFKAACTDLVCLGEFSDSIKVDVVLDSIPAPIVVNSIDKVCSGEYSTMTVQNCTNGTVNWTYMNGRYTYTSSGNTFSVSAFQKTTYKVTCTIGTCTSDTTFFTLKVANQNWISNIIIGKSILCNGGVTNLTHRLGALFPTGNIFKVQLSNKNGDFANPTIIGMSTGANDTLIAVTIPANTPFGNQYYIRIVPTVAPDSVGGYECFQLRNPLTIGVEKNNLYKSVSSCENTVLEISTSNYINPVIYNISWYKDSVNIDSLNQNNTKYRFKRVFAKKADEGNYSIKLTRLSDGCSVFSDNFSNSVNVPIAPPKLRDTTITRGNSVILSATGCGGSIIWHTYKRDKIFPSILAYNSPTYSTGKVFKDTTFYVSCLNGCYSERTPIKVTVSDPLNAPLPPILTIQNNNSCMESGQRPSITASGCNGIVRWAFNANFNYISETDSVPPFEFSLSYDSRRNDIYAQCVENGVFSKGSSIAQLFMKPRNPYISYLIAPYDASNNDTLTINQGSDLKLRVLKSNPEYCSNGTFKWYDSQTNSTEIGTGLIYQQSGITSNMDVYVSCTNDGCEDKRQKISILVDTDSVHIGIVNNNQAICWGGNTTILTTGCTNGIVKWHNQEFNGTLLFTGNDFTTPIYTSAPSSNIYHEFWVTCTVSANTSTRQKAVVIVSPPPSNNIEVFYASPTPMNPISNNLTFACNSFGYRISVRGCNDDYEITNWYSSDGRQVYPFSFAYGTSSIEEQNYDNKSKTFFVTCMNKITFCESTRDTINITFDCTPPPPPVISYVSNQQLSLKNTDNGLQTNLSVCANQELILFTNSCKDGGVFWSDGGVGNFRKIYPSQNILKLSATCTNISYVTSGESNSIGIQIKDTPKLFITNPPTDIASVNITLSSITAGSYLPVGSVLSYYIDSLRTLSLPNPQNITTSGKFFIKALNLNSCFDSKPVLVTITSCTIMYSILSGNWNTNAIWSCNRQPTITDNITISAGHTVTIPAGQTGFLNGLNLRGVLINNGRLKYKEL